jgi:hypothetical protein
MALNGFGLKARSAGPQLAGPGTLLHPERRNLRGNRITNVIYVLLVMFGWGIYGYATRPAGSRMHAHRCSFCRLDCCVVNWSLLCCVDDHGNVALCNGDTGRGRGTFVPVAAWPKTISGSDIIWISYGGRGYVPKTNISLYTVPIMVKDMLLQNGLNICRTGSSSLVAPSLTRACKEPCPPTNSTICALYLPH